MKKGFIILLWSILLLIMNGCTALQQKENGRPYWLDHQSYKGKICGIGIGKTKEEARGKGLDEIARQMGVKIDSKLEINEKRINDKNTKSFEVSSIQTVEGTIINAYIKDKWEDGDNIYLWMVSYKDKTEYENLIKGDMTDTEIKLQNDYLEKTSTKIFMSGKDYGNTAILKYAGDKNGVDEGMVSYLGKYSGIKLVDRKNIDKIIDEQKITIAGYADEKSAVETGKILGAQSIVIGETEINDIKIELQKGFLTEKEYKKTRLGINTKIIDSQTGLITFTDKYYNEQTEFIKESRYRRVYYVPSLAMGAALFAGYYTAGYPQRNNYKDAYGNTQSAAAYSKWNKAKSDFEGQSVVVGIIDAILSIGIAELSYQVFK